MKKEEFKKEFNLTEKQFNGKEEIKYSLDLRSLTSIPEGFNPTVGGSLYLSSLTSIPEGFNPTVGGSLDLSSLTSIPEGFNPTVCGYLYLNSLTSIPEGFNPTVGSYLYLSSLTSIPEGFNPTVGGSLYLRSLTSIPEGFNPTVGGSLYLSSLTSIPEGFNPTVGGSLDLSSLTSIPEGFNPTVGGSLYLRSLTSIPEGFNPTVGGSLYFVNNQSKHIGANVHQMNYIEFQDGKYILIDGIFCKVISNKKTVIHAKKYGSEKYFYIVSDGNGNYSHGNTIKEAKEDLIFKIGNRSKDNYKDLTTESKLTFEEAVKCYRVITGACQFGIKDFLQRKAINQKSFTISKIIELTNGEYGSYKFKTFFTK